jgi:DNA-binding NtrC family response regulator
MALTKAVLLVEDEPQIREMLEIALNDGGFDVKAAESGTNALSELESDPAKFIAVVTDIRLGTGPDGWAVGHRARELIPGVPVVYMSGDSAADWTSAGVPGSLVLAKPFAIAQLVTAVAHLLIEVDSRPS